MTVGWSATGLRDLIRRLDYTPHTRQMRRCVALWLVLNMAVTSMAQQGTLANGDAGFFQIMEPWPTIEDPTVRLQVLRPVCLPKLRLADGTTVAFSELADGTVEATAAGTGPLTVFCAGVANTQVVMEPLSEDAQGRCARPSFWYSLGPRCDTLEIAARALASGRLLHPPALLRQLPELVMRPGTSYGAVVSLPLNDGVSEDCKWGVVEWLWVQQDLACPVERLRVDTTLCRDPVLYRLEFKDHGPLWALVLWFGVHSAFVFAIAFDAASRLPFLFVAVSSLIMSCYVPLVTRLSFTAVTGTRAVSLSVPYLYWMCQGVRAVTREPAKNFRLPSRAQENAVKRLSVYACVQLLFDCFRLFLKR